MVEDKEWFSKIEKEHSSLENFLVERIKSGAEPLLFGYTPFQYLWKKELLIKGDVIRTNLQQRYIDCHYLITSEGNLEGIEAAGGQYSGKKGIYTPKEILNLKNCDNGWTLCFFAKNRIQLSLRNLNKI
jgi:hypothetical protein